MCKFIIVGSLVVASVLSPMATSVGPRSEVVSDDVRQDEEACSALQVGSAKKRLIRTSLSERKMKAIHSLSLANPLGSGYFATVTIDNVDFPVMVDTGSALLWVPAKGAQCAGIEATAQLKSCTESNKSSLPSIIGDALGNFNQIYGAGAASGRAFEAAVSLAGLTFKGIAGAADVIKQPTGFFSSQEDGYIGLGGPAMLTWSGPNGTEEGVFSDLSEEQRWQTNPIHQMFEQGLIDAPIFSLKLTPKGEDGVLVLGGVDDSLYTGHLAQAPLYSVGGFWGLKFDTGRFSELQFGTVPVALDSGASVIGMPSSYLSWWASFVKRSGTWIILQPLVPGSHLTMPLMSCNATEKLSGFSFALGAVTFELSMAEIAISDKDLIGATFSEWPTPPSFPAETCLIPFVPFDREYAFLLGQPFLRSVYAVFSQEKSSPHIKLAKQK